MRLPSVALLALLASAQAGRAHTPFAREADMEQRVSSAWYTNDFPLSDVCWPKYTSLVYSFANTTENPSVLSLLDLDKEILPQFVQAAHENDVEAHLAIGGWTGSRFFSSNVGNEQNRTIFASAIKNLIDHYGLDGINFDWEYPGRQGIGCNVVSPNDMDNFLSLLKTLRAQANPHITLSAAVSLTPFTNASGKPSQDVSAFAEVLDYIQIMNYDVSGPWSANFSANAPLDDSCAPPGQQLGSATSAVKAWVAAGMPANKIVLGVPAYGHSVVVNLADALEGTENKNRTQLAPYPAVNSSIRIPGDEWDDPSMVDVCGVLEPPAGVWTFHGLVEHGLLVKDQTGLFSPALSLYSRFDTCSRTPFIYNASSQVMISYDDELSFFAKGAFIRSNGLRGFAIWDARNDYQNTLVDAIRLAAGFGSN